MTDPRLPRDDDQLQELLGRALAGLDVRIDDPVPPPVTEGSLWVHDFVNADAELAAIVADSDRDELTGVRGTASVRSVSFATDAQEIDLEITRLEGERRRLAGMILPAATGTARLVIGGQHFDTEVDEHGRFVFDDTPSGTALITLTVAGRTLRLDPVLI